MKKAENLIPKGWYKLNGTLTEPNGCIWIYNGKSFFEKGENGEMLRKSKVLIVDRELFEKNSKKIGSYTQGFIAHHGKSIFYNL